MSGGRKSQFSVFLSSESGKLSIQNPQERLEMNDKTGIVETIEVENIIAGIIRREIRTNFDSNIPTLLETISSTIKQERIETKEVQPLIDGSPALPPKHREDIAGFQQQIDDLKAQILSLENEKRVLESCLEDSNEAGAQKLRESQLEVKQLQNIILSSVPSHQDPTDDEVVHAFGLLRNHIRVLVRKHFNPYGPAIGVCKVQSIAPIHQPYFIQSIVATAIYDSFFAPGQLRYGFDTDLDHRLAVIEQNLMKGTGVSETEVVDWRVRTAQMAQFYGTEEDNSQKVVDDAVKTIRQSLDPQVLWNTPDLRGRKDEMMNDFNELCMMAYHTALILRCSRVAYGWMQKDLSRFSQADVEVVGSVGHISYEESDSWMNVFGAVVKGTGVSGSNIERFTVIRKAEVFLSP